MHCRSKRCWTLSSHQWAPTAVRPVCCLADFTILNFPPSPHYFSLCFLPFVTSSASPWSSLCRGWPVCGMPPGTREVLRYLPGMCRKMTCPLSCVTQQRKSKLDRQYSETQVEGPTARYKEGHDLSRLTSPPSQGSSSRSGAHVGPRETGVRFVQLVANQISERLQGCMWSLGFHESGYCGTAWLGELKRCVRDPRARLRAVVAPISQERRPYESSVARRQPAARLQIKDLHRKQGKIRQSATVWLSCCCSASVCARSPDLQHLVRRADVLNVGRGYFSAESRNTKYENGFVSRVSPQHIPPWTSKIESKAARRSPVCRSLMTGTVQLPRRLAAPEVPET